MTLKIQFRPFKYPENTEPKGFLPDDMRAQACWYFYTIAQSAFEMIGDGPESQIITEDDLWMDKRYVDQAWSVCKMYGIENPDELFRFWPYVMKEAEACGLPEPKPEYMRPIKRTIY